MVIVQQLGKVLPAEYVAGPRVHLGSQAEVDVAMFEQFGTGVDSSSPESGRTSAVTTWEPVQPTLVMETELGDFDEYEVRIYDVRRNRRLVAAIELISPGNKDRPESRHQCVAKCAALLKQNVCVVLVDFVMIREFKRSHGMLLSMIKLIKAVLPS